MVTAMATIYHHRDTGHCQPILRIVILVAATATLGWGWRWGKAGPALAPLLVWILARTPERRHRFAAAAAYFLAGSIGLPQGAATFFGPGHELLGTVFWIASAILLALPWIWASNCTGTVIALILDAVPPLGCFGWLSPLTAAGVLYPGTGLAGLAMLLGLYAAIGARHRSLVAVTLILATVANLAFLPGNRPSVPPPGWIGIDTSIGPVSSNPWQAAMQRSAWLAKAQNSAREAKIVILPETIAGPWLPGTAEQIRAAIPARQIWLVGATAWVSGQRADALMEVSRSKTPNQPLFVSPFPVPVSMWRPWTRDGYLATWWEPVRTLTGVRTWVAICYDQLLPWIWIEAVVQSPDVVLAVSNDWWARGTKVAQIQRATTWAWVRLMNIEVLKAENHQGLRD